MDDLQRGARRRTPTRPTSWLVPGLPDSDKLPDAVLRPNNFLQSHYDDATTRRCSTRSAPDADTASREETLGEIQDRIADQVPILPLLTGAQVAIGVDDVKGVSDTLDASFKFRLHVAVEVTRR